MADVEAIAEACAPTLSVPLLTMFNEPLVAAAICTMPEAAALAEAPPAVADATALPVDVTVPAFDMVAFAVSPETDWNMAGPASAVAFANAVPLAAAFAATDIAPELAMLARADPAGADTNCATPLLAEARACADVPVAFAATVTPIVPVLLSTAEALPPTVEVAVGTPARVPVTMPAVLALTICMIPPPE